MKILGIDTSSKILSIALSEDKNILKEETHLLDRKHSSLLVPKIEKMLKDKNLSINDIDMFVIGLGPGSFTGLRIGVSTVKGFGIATKKLCVGVSSLDALALNANEGDLIVPILDAKREKVYSAIYKKEKNRIIKKSKHLLLSIDELMKKIKEKTVFLGDGIMLYEKRIRHFNKKAVFLKEECWYPKASNLIKLALLNGKNMKRANLSKLDPIYLYPKDCQVKKVKR